MTLLEPSQPSLCKAEFFIELAARVWKATPDGNDHKTRVGETVAYLEQLAAGLRVGYIIGGIRAIPIPTRLDCRGGPGGPDGNLASEAGELRKQGIRIRLQPKPLHILCLLLEKNRRIVGKSRSITAGSLTGGASVLTCIEDHDGTFWC